MVPSARWDLKEAKGSLQLSRCRPRWFRQAQSSNSAAILSALEGKKRVRRWRQASPRKRRNRGCSNERKTRIKAELVYSCQKSLEDPGQTLPTIGVESGILFTLFFFTIFDRHLFFLSVVVQRTSYPINNIELKSFFHYDKNNSTRTILIEKKR